MLDQTTLLVGYSTTTLILSLALLVAARAQRRFGGLDLWSIAGLLIGIVPLEVASYDYLPSPPPNLVIHLTVLAGMVCLRAGMAAYTEQSFPRRLYLGVGLAWLLCDALAEWIGVRLQFRVGVLGVLVAATLVDSGLLLARSPLWALPAHRVTARLLFLLAAGVSVRAVGIAVFGRSDAVFGPHLIIPFGLLLVQGMHAVLGVSLMLMVWSRLDRELQDHVDRLEAELVRDLLTGALNRRGLQREAELIFKGAGRYEWPVSLICLDIDHFKYVNDTHGHDVGDAVLKILVATIQPHLRASDRIARLGGEEFAVFLPGTGLEAAASVAERLRRSVEETSVALTEGALRFTCSFGIAERRQEEAELAPLLTRADQALYEAKRAGRNCVCRSAGSMEMEPERAPSISARIVP
jgi:diguanylate cyclase (GGDEF)-like protein